jgi:hypothetical protein
MEINLNKASGWIYIAFCLFTSMIGYHKHHDISYAILDWIFAPIVWIYWFVTQQINLTIINETFAFFFK